MSAEPGPPGPPNGPAEKEDVVDRGASTNPGAGAPRCDLCGGTMIDRHCKLSCSVCGYQRDCSDP